MLTAGVVDTLGRCFSHAELNCLVAGVEEFPVEAWRAATRHEAGCEAMPQIAWFWAAVAAQPHPTRARLLAFVTGSPVLPAGGFACLRGFNGAPHPITGAEGAAARAVASGVCLAPSWPLALRCADAPPPAHCACRPPPPTVALVATEGDARLPRASTCFNTLILPAYNSAEVLQARLLLTVSGAHAFDEGEPACAALARKALCPPPLLLRRVGACLLPRCAESCACRLFSPSCPPAGVIRR